MPEENLLNLEPEDYRVVVDSINNGIVNLSYIDKSGKRIPLQIEDRDETGNLKKAIEEGEIQEGQQFNMKVTKTYKLIEILSGDSTIVLEGKF